MTIPLAASFTLITFFPPEGQATTGELRTIENTRFEPFSLPYFPIMKVGFTMTTAILSFSGRTPSSPSFLLRA